MSDDRRMCCPQLLFRLTVPVNRCCLVIVATVAVLLSDRTVHAANRNGVLHWTSGDSLPGRLIRITDRELIWESGLFATPLHLKRSVLSSVSFEPGDVPFELTDAFRVVLHTGDVLFGNLRSLDPRILELAGARYGDVRIPRELIAGIERINHDGLIYLGPAGRDGWTGNALEKHWREQTDGSLTSSTANALLVRDLRSENKLAVEIVLGFNQIPEFVLALGRDDENSLRLETWDDALVVCNQDDFLEIQRLQDDTSRIHLLMYVDMESRRMLICSPRGEVLAELEELNPKYVPQALSLRNVGSQLTLQHLRVERWNGTTLGSLVAGRTGVQQISGLLNYGVVESITDGKVTLRTETDIMTIPVEDVGSLEVSATGPEYHAEPPETAARVKWRDGGLLHGDIVRMTKTAATLQPPWSSTPVTANPEGIQTVKFFGSVSEVAGPDKLLIEGRLLHGHLVVDAGDQPVTWKPTGATTGAALQSGDTAVVTRSVEASAVSIDPRKFPDTIYLRNNDIIPCHLEKISDHDVRLSSPFTSTRQFPSRDIRALELSSVRQSDSQGFADANWKQADGQIRKDGGSVELRNGSFGHQHGMVSDRISFRVRWVHDQWTSMTVHLFVGNLQQPKTSSACVLMFSGNNVVVTRRLDHQNPFAVMQNPDLRVRTNGATAEIQLVTSRGLMEVIVNGKAVEQFPLERTDAGNTGILFELSQAAGGRFFDGKAPGVNKGEKQKVRYLTLSNLETGPPSAASIQKFIDNETRELALTIPRFRRGDPSTHVLIAPNGDVLRGRLVAVHSDHVEFESRLEMFQFPRERVAAIVWIVHPKTNRPADGPPAKPQPRPAQSTVLQTVLSGGFLVSMTPTGLSEGLLYGESPVLGRCSVPAVSISRLHLGDPQQRSNTAAYSQWRARHASEPDWDIARNNGDNAPGTELIGRAAPDFELPQVNGETFRLSENAGKIVVLDFWATWCGPCVAALPDYVEATNHFNESELAFVAVNIEESPQQIRAFLKEHELNLRVAVDGGSQVASQYGVSGIPHSLIIGPEGTIEYVHVGYSPDTGAEIQRVAEEILSGSWTRNTTPSHNLNSPAERSPESTQERPNAKTSE